MVGVRWWYRPSSFVAKDMDMVRIWHFLALDSDEATRTIPHSIQMTSWVSGLCFEALQPAAGCYATGAVVDR